MIFKHKLRLAAARALFVFALAAIPAQGQAELLGPLRVRDLTPFNLLRLDMLPAHDVTGDSGSWAIEADISHANTFVMSGNVSDYLARRGMRGPLEPGDVE